DATLDLVVDGRAVCVDGFALILDAADNSAEHLGGLVAGAAACRRDLNLRLVAPCIIDYKKIVNSNLIITQGWSVTALRPGVRIPLVPVMSVSISKLSVK